MFAILKALFEALLGWFAGRGRATEGEIIDSNARAQEQLAHERAANEAESTAAHARADAADRVVRATADGASGADGADALRREFPDEFRV
jgi:hypothetical protein